MATVLPAYKWAQTLLSALQINGKCANDEAARKYINEVVDTKNAVYAIRRDENKESVLTRFGRFTNELNNKIGNQCAIVLGGYLGVELFTQWDKEQRDSLVFQVLDECVTEILTSNKIIETGLNTSQLREALLVICNTPTSPFPAELAAVLAGLQPK
jgi:hypothetical protein